MFFKSCNCNSSIATRVGFAVCNLQYEIQALADVLCQIIFCLNSLLAWLMRTDFAIKQIEKWSYDYIKMDCAGDKCYGVLAVFDFLSSVSTSLTRLPQVHRICFALTLFHTILSLSLIGVKDTRDKRAAVQNG